MRSWAKEMKEKASQVLGEKEEEEDSFQVSADANC